MNKYKVSLKSLQEVIDGAKKLKKDMKNKKVDVACDKIIEGYEELQEILVSLIPANDGNSKK